MKLKVKIDPNAIQQFFLYHVEKILFGVVVLCFMVFAYRAIARERLDWGPDELSQRAKGAKDHLSATEPVLPTLPKFTKAAERLRVPINDVGFEVKPSFDVPLWQRKPLRGTPELYAIQELRTAAGHGSFAMTMEDGGGMGRMPGMAVGGSGVRGVQGQRWAVVTGVFDFEKQVKAFQVAYEDTEFRDPKGDFPDYAYYRIERAEVDPRQESAEPQWEKMNLKKAMAVQDKWRSSPKEVVDENYLPPDRNGISFAFPLGPLQDRIWGSEVGHPRIPLRIDRSQGDLMPGAYGARSRRSPTDAEEFAEEDIDPDAAKAAKPETPRELPATDEPDEPDAPDETGGPRVGGPGRMSGPAMPGMPGMRSSGPRMPGARGSGMRGPGTSGRRGPMASGMGDEQEELPKHLLFRFFDYSVEPGKHYRYRVKLMLTNPNYGVPPRFLQTESLGKQPFVETEWSEPTPVTSVPLDSQVLAGSVKPQDSSASLMIVRFNMETGTVAYEEFEAPRGQFLNFLARPFSGGPESGAMPMRGAVLTGDEEEEVEMVDYVTESVLLDAHGGGRLPGRDRLTEPGNLLVLDQVGNLVVRHELDDYFDYTKYKDLLEEPQRRREQKEEMEMAPPRMPPAGGRGAAKRGAGPAGMPPSMPMMESLDDGGRTKKARKKTP